MLGLRLAEAAAILVRLVREVLLLVDAGSSCNAATAAARAATAAAEAARCDRRTVGVVTVVVAAVVDVVVVAESCASSVPVVANIAPALGVCTAPSVMVAWRVGLYQTSRRSANTRAPSCSASACVRVRREEDWHQERLRDSESSARWLPREKSRVGDGLRVPLSRSDRKSKTKSSLPTHRAAREFHEPLRAFNRVWQRATILLQERGSEREREREREREIERYRSRAISNVLYQPTSGGRCDYWLVLLRWRRGGLRLSGRLSGSAVCLWRCRSEARWRRHHAIAWRRHHHTASIAERHHRWLLWL